MNNERKLRILILNWRYLGHPKSGGAEFWTRRVSEELIARGHQVTVFTSCVKGLPGAEVIDGVNVIRRGGQLTVYWWARKLVRKRSQEFDFILDEVNTRPFFAHRHSKVPSRAMFHQIAGDVWRFETPTLIALVGRHLLEPIWIRRFKKHDVLVLSQSTADSLKNWGVKTLKVVHPGVDQLIHTPRTKPKEPTICFLGRLVPSKRPLDVINAFKLVQTEFQDARLIMIGDGPLRSQIRQIAPNSVTVTGKISDSDRNAVISSSHVLVATSIREGWGMNVTEAAELGVPSIGYDVPGLRDSIAATGGMLVCETPSSLANALIEFFSSEKRPVARKLARTWGDVAAELEEIMLQDVNLASITQMSLGGNNSTYP